MAELTLRSRRFREERELAWLKLEDILRRAEHGSASTLTDDELLALPVLYRAALSSLSMARAISLDQSLIAYLESLCTRAYFYVYGTRTTFIERIGQFFRTDWRDAVKDLWRETLVTTAFTILGVVVAYVLTERDASWFYSFVPGDLAEGRVPSASAVDLRDTLFHPARDGLSVFATYLFTHNAQIALFAFALGFACCLPTVFLILYNGMTLGAFIAVFYSHGLGIEFGGWLLIHGTTELFAIILSGAAGLRLGWTLAFPGTLSRMEAMSAAGRKASITMTGTLLMLVVAGMSEGIARQMVTDTAVRYGIAFGVLALWLLYFYLPQSAEE